MRNNCLKVPRILLPREGFEQWAVIACDQFTSDRAYWQRVEKNVGSASSTLNFILPEAYLGEDDEARISAIRENMFAALEGGTLEKLVRGCVLTERTVKAGVRRGIIAAIDLEAYSSAGEKGCLIRASEEVVPSRLPARVALRRASPLEFPHAILFYNDKKDKIMKALADRDLEELYDFDLMEGGGHIKGYFIPEDLSEAVAEAIQGKWEPCLAVADGNHSVAAAKAYWESLKPTLTKEELRSHPARFMLAELVNLYSPAVEFHPIHRLVKETDAAALCDHFMRAVKCKREGNVLIPALPAGAEGVIKTDAILEEFVRASGGKIDYIHGEKELCALAAAEDSVGVLLKPLDKDDFFDRLKRGGNFPKKTFSIGEGAEKRYYLEGREISYD